MRKSNILIYPTSALILNPISPEGGIKDVREVEFKSTLPPAITANILISLANTGDHPLLHKLRDKGLLPRGNHARVSMQHTYYADTRDCRLTKCGLSFRVRIQAENCTVIQGFKECKPTTEIQDRFENEGPVNIFGNVLPQLADDQLANEIYKSFIEIINRTGLHPKTFGKNCKEAHRVWLRKACAFFADHKGELPQPHQKKSSKTPIPTKIIQHCMLRAMIKKAHLITPAVIMQYGDGYHHQNIVQDLAELARKGEIGMYGHDEFPRLFIHLMYNGLIYELAIDMGQSQKNRFLQAEFEIEAKPTVDQVAARGDLENVAAIVVEIFKEIAWVELGRNLCPIHELRPSPSKGELNALARRAIHFQSRLPDGLIALPDYSQPSLHRSIEESIEMVSTIIGRQNGLRL